MSNLNSTRELDLDAQHSTIELCALLIGVIVCYCVLYGPQVILSNWIEEYQLSTPQASALVYITLVPMSVAPLTYGLLLGSLETRRIISVSLGALAAVTGLLAWAESYWLILTCRLLQGALLPAVTTATIARLSAASGTRGGQLISYYLCATVLGGLIGRLCMGHLALTWSLSAVWSLWALSLILVALALTPTPRVVIPFNAHRVSSSALKTVISNRRVRGVLMSSAMMFGVFAAALNLLPLRALELGLPGGSGAVANRYWGYLAGAVIALISQRIDARLGGEGRAPALGLVVMSLGLLWGTLGVEFMPLGVMVFTLCGGLFITHPLLAAHTAQLNPSERGLMSGLYVSSYYIGGALCSWVASEVIDSLGWEGLLYLLALIALFASASVWRAFRPH